jgi:hypothetical protein
VARTLLSAFPHRIGLSINRLSNQSP